MVMEFHTAYDPRQTRFLENFHGLNAFPLTETLKFQLVYRLAKVDVSAMNKALVGLLGFFTLVSISSLSAGDVPRGFMSISELEAAQAKAKNEKKLVAVVAKGSDDRCPRCAAAFENGIRAIRTDTVMVFTRVADLRKNNEVPAALKQASVTAMDGAAVTFYVFDSEISQLIASASRTELENDRNATREFKKQVNDARKALRQ